MVLLGGTAVAFGRRQLFRDAIGVWITQAAMTVHISGK